MTHRERVLATFGYEHTDRLGYDLMEGASWPELDDWFRRERGLPTSEEISSFLDADCRWTGMKYVGPTDTMWAEYCSHESNLTYSDVVCRRPLADASTIADVEAHDWPDPAWWQPDDYRATRNRYPDHALVAGPPWMPLFCYGCVAFGMEGILVKMLDCPVVVEAFMERLTDIYLDMLKRHLEAAKGVLDIIYLADDWAGNDGLVMGPELWRAFIKPHFARYTQLIADHGMRSMMHSCGSVRSVLPDLIDIGLNGLSVFQTVTAGMRAHEIARHFGGKMVFYGGIDSSRLLVSGTVDQVRAEVRSNSDAFGQCGGYIAANSHHGIANARPENLIAISESAHECRRAP
jgi:uroporphyrinogen decarboxylase